MGDPRPGATRPLSGREFGVLPPLLLYWRTASCSTFGSTRFSGLNPSPFAALLPKLCRASKPRCRRARPEAPLVAPFAPRRIAGPSAS